MAIKSFKVSLGIFRGMAVAVVALGFCMAIFSCAVAEDLRTWTDSTGKYKITAKFVALADGNVTLEREARGEPVVGREQRAGETERGGSEGRSGDAVEHPK